MSVPSGPSRRVGLVIVLLVVGTLVGSATVAATTPVETDPAFGSGQMDEIDADETRLEISLESDGTAAWRVAFWMRLDDQESEEAFESLRTDIEDDPDAYTQSFADRIDSTVATARNATGREMSADGFAVETNRQTLGPEFGVVTYSFRWHGFAAVDGDELRAGDAIEGIYLDDGTRLSIGWTEEYDLVSAAPDPDDRRDRMVIWRGGDTEFVSGEPRVVVTRDSGLGPTVIGAAVLTVGAIVAGAGWWYRNRGRSRPTTSSPADEDGTSRNAMADAGGAETESESAAKPDPRDDLLSNEERVLRLLEEYDGRMKQQTVVEELEWTDAKTSKVVSRLREEGKLGSYRLGRENVLTLPSADDADSDPD